MTTHTASRLIRASPEALYAAHLDPAAIAAWRPPQGMRAEIHAFDGREGGVYRMAFVYAEPPTGGGKTTSDADVFEGRFVELAPGERVVERVAFESEDPAFAGAMTVTTSFTPAEGGTRVDICVDDVPSGISEADHAAGMASSLAQLADFVEGR